MNILVTGGLGHIGSQTVIELLKNKHDVIIADNLINSKIEVLNKIHMITGFKAVFYKIDVTDEQSTQEIFNNHSIDGIIHFAGLKAVGESISKPLEYYYNNLVSTIILSKMCVRFGVNKFVFSSSATVYGNGESPFNEDMTLLNRTNPYGETKAMSECILTDTAKSNPNFQVTLLRYFNPVGSHASGLIGDVPNGILNNLMPYITQVASGKREKLYIYGNDYDTIDGTGVRDYIHVTDLAKGHVNALKSNNKGVWFGNPFLDNFYMEYCNL